MRAERKSEQGIALISTLLMGTLLVLLIAMGARYATSSASNMQLNRARAQALNVAEGGAEWAISRFDPLDLAVISTTSTFAGGIYQVSARSLSGGRYAIRSMAWVPSQERPLSTRSVEMILATASLKIGPYAIATGGDLSVSGAGDLSGDLHSNHDVYLSGSADIAGAVTAAGSVTPGSYEGASGGVTSHAEPISLPTFSEAQIQGYAAQAKAIATHAMTDPVGATLSGYYESYSGYDILDPGNTSGLSMELTGNQTVAIDGIVFIEGRLVLSGTTHLTGSGLIICTQGIRMTGNAELEGAFTVLTLSNNASAIDLAGNVEVEGLLLAPNGGLSVTGAVAIEGCLLAGGAGTVTGSVEITYEPSIDTNLLQSTFYDTKSYQEF